jgi:peptidoglycan/xylan/chitin deacetylase (PgdA/CDA1 family)
MSALRKLLKSAARGVLGSNVLSPIGRALGGPGSCLMYHRVASSPEFERMRAGCSPNRELAVSVEEFDRQMAYVAAHCKPLSLPEAVARLAKGRLEEGTVLVTFDDGYRDNLTEALPVLKKHGVPATIYLTTGMIGGELMPWWYEEEAIIASLDRISLEWEGRKLEFDCADAAGKTRAFNVLTPLLKALPPSRQRGLLDRLRGGLPRSQARGEAEFLTWDEARRLASDPLITIGAHTVNHHVLSRLGEGELREEMSASRQRLQAELGRPVEHFAYPFGGRGEAGEREFRMAAELGFASAFTTRIGHLKPSHRSSLHSLPRVVIGCHDSVEDLRWKLGGFDATLRKLRGEAA